MSDEMAVSDNATGDEAKLASDKAAVAGDGDALEVVPEQLAATPASEPENSPDLAEEVQPKPEPADESDHPPEITEPSTEVAESPTETKEPLAEMTEPLHEDTLPTSDEVKEETEDITDQESDKEEQRGLKRRASVAFSDIGVDEFKGFEIKNEHKVTQGDYEKILERLEAEVTAARKEFALVRQVMGTPTAPVRASKRPRKDTEGSRPSSALSSRSDGDGATDASAASSPANRRRATTEMSSPLLRLPLERGWKRELVFRAALDTHTKRNADIYYYTPQGKKLRSSREVSEHLSGTGLTLENFSFFKEPLGVDDPEKEIIRDAKMIRRVESPVQSPVVAVEGKRTPKPKAPKGASPEPQVVKSPPAKIKVKSVGSRLSTGAPPSSAPPAQAAAASTPPAPARLQKKPPALADNNNTAAWKKPRAPQNPPAQPPAPPAPPPAPPAQPPPPPAQHPAPPALATHQPPPPPPLQSRPPPSSPDVLSSGRVAQPCSMSCGRGAVPSLACAACLCLYHPACAHHTPNDKPFLCKNCRKSSSPPVEPPPLTHKSGVGAAPPSPPRPPLPARRPPPPATGTPKPARPDKRLLLRMKQVGGSWAAARAGRAGLPQSLALLAGRRFIVVPRSLLHDNDNTHEDKRPMRTRVANGAAGPPGALPAGSPAGPTAPPAGSPAGAPGASPRRRGRPRLDDTDYFTPFYQKARNSNYNVAVQMFQYLGMRDLAHCARVCRLWKEMADTPALWRHVRMKNSHVSHWGGLCAALRAHGTRRLDLRKMLLPQNDAAFWDQFAQHIAKVDTLERLEMCRCPARAVEAACAALPGLRALLALAIRDARLDPAPLALLPRLHELRLKSMAGLALTQDLSHLAALTQLTHLSLTSIKELGWCACDVIGSLPLLESLELGECTFRAEFGRSLARLSRLRRLRLERGTAACNAPALLRSLARLPLLTRLELVNIDVKVGFDDALAECKNIQRLLIIPTYVSQSATTNKQVLSGVLRLKDTLTHLMWGVTIELLRVTELFIDQCEQAGEPRRRDVGECIPVLKPVPGCKLPLDHASVAGPPQVEILPLPTLQRLLSTQLPNTKLKLLRIPFHATWRQSLADFH